MGGFSSSKAKTTTKQSQDTYTEDFVLEDESTANLLEAITVKSDDKSTTNFALNISDTGREALEVANRSIQFAEDAGEGIFAGIDRITTASQNTLSAFYDVTQNAVNALAATRAASETPPAIQERIFSPLPAPPVQEILTANSGPTSELQSMNTILIGAALLAAGANAFRRFA